MRNGQNTLVKELERMKPIWETRRRRKDNTEMDLIGIRRVSLDSVLPSHDRQVVGSCEYGDEHKVPCKSGKHL